MIETVTVLTDDLDGKTRANVETVTFMLDGTEYELELGQVNRRRLEGELRPYIDHARKVSHVRPARKPVSRRPAEIRQWAKERGIQEVSDRGRIPTWLENRYLRESA